MKNFYWRKESFESLKKVIELSRENSEWELYTKYCETIEKGLRKQALKILSEFIEQLKGKSLEDRIQFTNWIEERRMKSNEVVVLIPSPLQKNLIEPTLNEWKDKEPNNPIPYRWINSKESLLRAIELDDKEEIARFRLFKKIISWIENNQHELQDYFGSMLNRVGNSQKASKFGG